MSSAIHEPESEEPSRTRLLPWILAGGLLLLVILLAFQASTIRALQYKDSVVLRVLATDSTLPLGAIDANVNTTEKIDASITDLEVPVARVRWESDEYGFPLCHIEPRKASISNVSQFLSSHADRAAVVFVDGRAVHVIHLAESSPEHLVLRTYYPGRGADDQPFRDMKALREHLIVRTR